MREELAACADDLLSKTDDPTERDILGETKLALLAYYEGQEPA